MVAAVRLGARGVPLCRQCRPSAVGRRRRASREHASGEIVFGGLGTRPLHFTGWNANSFLQFRDRLSQ